MQKQLQKPSACPRIMIRSGASAGNCKSRWAWITNSRHFVNLLALLRYCGVSCSARARAMIISFCLAGLQVSMDHSTKRWPQVYIYNIQKQYHLSYATCLPYITSIKKNSRQNKSNTLEDQGAGASSTFCSTFSHYEHWSAILCPHLHEQCEDARQTSKGHWNGRLVPSWPPTRCQAASLEGLLCSSHWHVDHLVKHGKAFPSPLCLSPFQRPVQCPHVELLAPHLHLDPQMGSRSKSAPRSSDTHCPPHPLQAQQADLPCIAPWARPLPSHPRPLWWYPSSRTTSCRSLQSTILRSHCKMQRGQVPLGIPSRSLPWTWGRTEIGISAHNYNTEKMPNETFFSTTKKI